MLATSRTAGIRHRGRHEAIIPPDDFEAVQHDLSGRAARARGQASARSPSLLAGLIVDEAGRPLTPTHANKKGRRYRYYVSRSLIGDAHQTDGSAPKRQRSEAEGWRLPAGEIELLVVDALRELVLDQSKLMDRFGLGLLRPDDLDRALKAGADLADTLKVANAGEQRALLQALLARIEIAAERVTLIIKRQALWDELGAIDPKGTENQDLTVELTISVRLARRGSELKLVLGDRQVTRRDRGLIGKLAQGFLWFEELRTGAVSSLGEIAEREGMQTVMVRRACDLAFLSTDLIEAILAGDQPVELNSEAVKVAYPLPIAWEEQRRVLGFA